MTLGAEPTPPAFGWLLVPALAVLAILLVGAPLRRNPWWVKRARPGRGERAWLGPYSLRSALFGAMIRSRKGRPYEVWGATGGRQRKRIRRYLRGKATYRAPGTQHPLGVGW